jgi:hypothetical protein
MKEHDLIAIAHDIPIQESKDLTRAVGGEMAIECPTLLWKAEVS